MIQNYSHILTFIFKHRYFSDELFRTVDVTYDDETKKTVKNLDLIIKPFEGGIHLLTSQPELLSSLNSSVSIRLYFNCKDPQFHNYTELPEYQLSSGLLYFNNISTSSNKSIHLQSEKSVGQSEIVQVSSGIINIPDYDSAQTYRFADATGTEIPSQFIKYPRKGLNKFTLENYQQGLVLVSIGNKEVGKVYYNPNPIWKKPLGVVDIFIGALIKQFEKIGTIEYVINFNNRKTIWKYFLVSAVYQKFNNLSIINKGKEQVFKEPQKQLVHQNPEVLVFESKNEISLAEFSEENFQLVDNFDPKNHSGKIVLKSLAKASPDQLYNDVLNPSDKTYSHIYI